MTIPLTFRYRVQNTANSNIETESIEPVYNVVNSTPNSPLHTFRIPEGLLDTTAPFLRASPVLSQLSPLLQPSVSLPPSPLPLSCPTKPLHPERIEMAIIWYKRTKQSWLAQNPHIQPKNYRKARNFKTIQNVQQWYHHLPQE